MVGICKYSKYYNNKGEGNLAADVLSKVISKNQAKWMQLMVVPVVK